MNENLHPLLFQSLAFFAMSKLSSWVLSIFWEDFYKILHFAAKDKGKTISSLFLTIILQQKHLVEIVCLANSESAHLRAWMNPRMNSSSQKKPLWCQTFERAGANWCSGIKWGWINIWKQRGDQGGMRGVSLSARDDAPAPPGAPWLVSFSASQPQ